MQRFTSSLATLAIFVFIVSLVGMGSPNPVKVLRMDRQPELVLLARGGKHAKTELVHEPPVG